MEKEEEEVVEETTNTDLVSVAAAK